MNRKMRIILTIAIIIKLLTIFIICGGLIYLVRYEIRSKYNVRPERICNEYLEKTYGKKFTMIDKIYFTYNEQHVWGFKYEDEEGIEFWEYYRYPYRFLIYGPNYLFDEKTYGENRIRDNYWRTILRYGDVFDLETYEFVGKAGLWEYEFTLEDEEKMEQLAQKLSKLYMYTLNNVKEASPQILQCRILVQDDNIGYKISDGWINLADEEEVYNFVYEQIEKAWEKSEYQ